MSSLNSKPLVLLTGPNGFVGAHVLDRLLSEGYKVRGTVRSQAKADFFQKKVRQPIFRYLIFRRTRHPGAKCP
jgi:nucleoside-diphosphate-sugar epimerase